MSDARTPVLTLTASTRDESFVLREDEFRLLYDRTAKALWVYLFRLTRDTHVADDLLQETYYRFLRTPSSCESELHERNVLYRIATNLARDARRRLRPTVPIDEPGGVVLAGSRDAVHGAGDRADVQRALARLKGRDQELLWLAYAEGASHEEIAASLGLRTSSVKTLLFRARRRLAALLPQRTAGRSGGEA